METSRFKKKLNLVLKKPKNKGSPPRLANNSGLPKIDNTQRVLHIHYSMLRG